MSPPYFATTQPSSTWEERLRRVPPKTWLANVAAFQSHADAERVRLARLARFQRSSTATRTNNSPGTL